MAEQIPPATPLHSCPERSIGLSLPIPITARIDLLVELAEQAGERTSRKEIVATCILGAPDRAEELVRWLRLYRNSRADSTATAGAKLEDVLELRPARPGPRARHWRHRSPLAPPLAAGVSVQTESQPPAQLPDTPPLERVATRSRAAERG